MARKVLDGLGDIDAEVGHPLQVLGQAHDYDDGTQVDGDRRLAGDQLKPLSSTSSR